MKKIKAREVPELETHRLRLRLPTLEDSPAILDFHSDEQTLEYWGHELISDLSQAEDIIRTNLEWVESGSCLHWSIEYRSSGEVIGACTLFKIDEQNRHAEVGYILNREYWGRGLASEALEAMIEYAFGTMDMHRLEADTDPRNVASLALLAKFGFIKEGFFRERWWVHGQWLDSDMLGLLKSDYLKLRNRTGPDLA